jgi:hypothetical protein
VNPLAGLLVAGAALLALVIGILVVKSRPDTKERELRATPGFDLTYPDGKLLDRTDIGSAGGAGATHQLAYGTTQPQEAIEAYFDTHLQPLGYEVVRGPEPGDHGSTLVREYRRGPVKYAVELRPLPRKVGTTWMRSGYPYILYMRMENK